mmetsp:Transcript_11453/g.32959  ORF Transcript_11453/g.32959 Transcript_11453/m.32959 type:complete len:283 (-) Transcript_11453:597-1445(-)
MDPCGGERMSRQWQSLVNPEQRSVAWRSRRARKFSFHEASSGVVDGDNRVEMADCCKCDTPCCRVARRCAPSSTWRRLPQWLSWNAIHPILHPGTRNCLESPLVVMIGTLRPRLAATCAMGWKRFDPNVRSPYTSSLMIGRRCRSAKSRICSRCFSEKTEPCVEGLVTTIARMLPSRLLDASFLQVMMSSRWSMSHSHRWLGSRRYRMTFAPRDSAISSYNGNPGWGTNRLVPGSSKDASESSRAPEHPFVTITCSGQSWCSGNEWCEAMARRASGEPQAWV